MVKKRGFFFIIILIWSVNLYGFGSWGSIGRQWGSGFEHVWGFAKGIGNALAQMVGHISPAYIFNFEVYNGLQSTVHVQTRHYDKVMGGRFAGGISNSADIAPGATSEDAFNQSNVHLYFNLEIPSCGYSEAHYTLGEKNDTTIYVYHTYNDPDSYANKAERLGVVKGGSDAFSGLIYNGAGRTATVGFVWNKKQVEIPVEAGTFNALKSTDNNSLRPSVLVLNGQSVAVGSTGLGTSTTTGSGKSAKTTSMPTRYNYQITPHGGIETGLFPGNFKQPSSGTQLRDITPMDCQIWNELTATQEGQAWSLKPISMVNEPLWYMYTGQGINPEGSVVNQPIGQVPPGKCAALTLLRPSVSQGTAKLYMVRIRTTDTATAANFLNELATMKLPVYTVQSPTQKFIEATEKTLLSEKLPDGVGYLTSSNGIKGVIVGMDIFASYGAASIGPYYYTVPAPEYAISSVQSVFTQSITNLTAGASKELNTYIQEWIETYPTNPLGVKKALEIFLIKNGSKTMIAKNGDEESLNLAGYAVLDTLLYGPQSISRMPVWYPNAQKTVITPPATWVSQDNIVVV